MLVLTESIKQKIDDVIKKDVADKISELFISKNMIQNIVKEINVPTNFFLGIDHCINSAYTRSFSSSLGTNLQTAATHISEICGWKVLNDSSKEDGKIKIEGVYSDETRILIDNIMTHITKSNKKSPLTQEYLDEAHSKIVDKVLTTVGQKKHNYADIIIQREVGGKILISNIELKLGGDLDKGKANSQRRESFEIFALLVSKYKDEIRAGKVEIKSYFATIYNKNDLLSGSEKWSSPSVTKNFTRDELLIGKDFWNHICLGDPNAFEYIMSAYHKNCTIVYEKSFKKLKEIIYDKVKSNISERDKKFYDNIDPKILNFDQ